MSMVLETSDWQRRSALLGFIVRDGSPSFHSVTGSVLVGLHVALANSALT